VRKRTVAGEFATTWLLGVDVEQALDDLERLLRADELVKASHMIAVLASTKDRAAGRRIAELVRPDTDPILLRGALRALGRIGDHANSGPVIRLLREPGFARQWAAEALGKIGDPSAIPALLATFQNESDPYLRRRLIAAIFRIGGTKARQIRGVLWRQASPAERLVVVRRYVGMILREAPPMGLPLILLARIPGIGWRYVGAGAFGLAVVFAVRGQYWVALLFVGLLLVSWWRLPSAPGPRR
jgi:HEAT repeats